MTAVAEAQAAMLTAVASHLTTHPDLGPVNILSNDRLQLRYTDAPGRSLAAWADTLTDPTVDVQVIHCEHTDAPEAFVYIVGGLGEDLPVSVWDMVPGLADALGPDVLDDTNHVEITVDGLRAYAQDGTAPQPAGSLAPA